MKPISNHIARCVLMIEPVAFGYNPETAGNNYFQQPTDAEPAAVQQLAHAEYTRMVETLRAKGIDVISIRDTEQPLTPDSIFPNNWISFDAEGQVVLYPMYAKNRRSERRLDILDIIEKQGHQLNNVVDFSFGEDENRFLEGTGSMVFDHQHKIAYAALSERTDKSVFLQYCETFGFEPVAFTAYQTVANERKPVYHTNVMLCVADTFAVICAESIDNEQERSEVLASLRRTHKIVVEISESQMHAFAGNMLQLANARGERFLVMSQTAFDTLTADQLTTLSGDSEIIVCPIPTIEQMGGGSVRCMMAEVFC